MKPNTLPAPDLDVETCQRHRVEFPAFLTCPRCSEEREGLAFANHYARKRQQGAAMPGEAPEDAQSVFVEI